MENKIVITFIKESISYSLNFDQPDFASFVRMVLSRHLEVSAENIKVETDVEGFDIVEFKDILIAVHEEFQSELDQFFVNIESDVRTYYDDDLSEAILERVKNELQG